MRIAYILVKPSDSFASIILFISSFFSFIACVKDIISTESVGASTTFALFFLFAAF
ncbi:hypothetical protein Fmac_026242 [Flemingia macrophylla]|uniref:Uncharacterized protein n=1 Tax=Flemingia macrophylla TaxID=520843 RepID=A0ABD1LEJ5_9FABA